MSFSRDGNSHMLELSVPPYSKDPLKYEFNFDTKLNYSVLIDNGIPNESTRFQKFFPDAKIIKMCYSDFSWPVVANTMIVKAMLRSIKSELSVDKNSWNTIDNWAQREKYFLFLRDNALRNAWKPDSISCAVLVEDLLDYAKLHSSLTSFGIELENFEDLHHTWWRSNQKYFQPVIQAQQFVNGEIDVVNDLWTQSVVYYQIWCLYGVEVPHNDLANFFDNHKHYQDWLHNAL